MTVAIITKGMMEELITHHLKTLSEVTKIVRYTAEDDFIPTDEYLMIASGDMKLRRKMWDKYKNYSFINVFLSSFKPEKMGKGNYVFPTVFFDKFTEIGNNNIISAGTIVSHHSKIGDSNLFGPGCLLSGHVTIGNNCTMGSGIIFQPYVEIADNTTIPSGAVIVSNLDNGVIAKRDKSIFSGKYSYSHKNK